MSRNVKCYTPEPGFCNITYYLQDSVKYLKFEASDNIIILTQRQLECLLAQMYIIQGKFDYLLTLKNPIIQPNRNATDGYLDLGETCYCYTTYCHSEEP